MLTEAEKDVRDFFWDRWQLVKNKLQRVPTMVHWLTQYGIVGDTAWSRAKYEDEFDGLHYAWIRSGKDVLPGMLITVWCEGVSIDDKGVWYFEDNLDPYMTSDGKIRDELQRSRTHERAQILKAAYEQKMPVDAILLENERTREQLRSPKHPASKIKNSLRDEFGWNVVRWTDDPPRALVVRGPVRPGWRAPGDETADPALSFPDQAHRDKVEAAAIKAVTQHYSGQYRVVSREKDCLGFDLELTSRDTGAIEFLLEVKGTAGATPHFFITRNEMKRAEEDSNWRLVIVTQALTEEPIVGASQTWAEVEERFQRTALAWHASLKNPAAREADKMPPGT